MNLTQDNGVRIKQLMTAAGVNIETLSELLMVHPETIRRWRRGDTTPNYSVELFLKEKIKCKKQNN